MIPLLPRGRSHRTGGATPLRRRDSSPRRATRLSLLLVLLPVLGGCTFEPRAGVEEETASPGEPSVNGGTVDSIPLGPAAAVQTVELFRSSVEVGDLSLALSLVDREATLIDALVGAASEAATRGELLLELRRRYAEGMRLESVETEVTPLADGAALVLSTLVLLETREDGIGEEVGRLRETALLIGSPEGWRIRHLHRSFSPGMAVSAPPGTNE